MATPLDDRLAEIESRYEAVSAELSAPDVANDQERMRDLGRSFAELQEIVTPYREYRQVLAQASEARQMEAAESEPEMAAFFRDEADRAEERAEELRGALELLLIPKDPNDGKNVIVEIRAGTGRRRPCGRRSCWICIGATRNGTAGRPSSCRRRSRRAAGSRRP